MGGVSKSSDRKGAVLVTGGASYLGAHTVLALKAAGYHVTVLDDLSTGCRKFTDLAEHFVRLDVRDRSAVSAILSRLKPEAVIHLAGRHRVEDSFIRPEVISEVSIGGTASLLAAMRETRLSRLIYASSLGVYGDPGRRVVTEQEERHPRSPLARAQMMVEDLLDDARHAFELETVALRLAVIAGADSRARAGEAQPPFRSTVVRLVRVMLRDNPVASFPAVWTTEDGQWKDPQTLDLLHVSDAADAFVAVMERLVSGSPLPPALNVSSGRPTPVDRLVQAAEAVGGRPVHTVRQPLARGEAAWLVASHDRLTELTGWTPRASDPESIITSALAWERQRRQSGVPEP